MKLIIFSAAALLLPLRQETNEGPKVDSIGRQFTATLKKGAGDHESLYMLVWPSPATYGDEFKAIWKCSTEIFMQSIKFKGIENSVMKVQIRNSAKLEGGKQSRGEDDGEYLVAAIDGKYYFYPSNTVDVGLGFLVTPNSPKPGMFRVELLKP